MHLGFSIIIIEPYDLGSSYSHLFCLKSTIFTTKILGFSIIIPRVWNRTSSMLGKWDRSLKTTPGWARQNFNMSPHQCWKKIYKRQRRNFSRWFLVLPVLWKKTVKSNRKTFDGSDYLVCSNFNTPLKYLDTKNIMKQDFRS